MRNLLLKAAVLVGALSLWGGNALAAPLGRALNAPFVILADWQCGPGWHVTPWGECRLDHRFDYRYSLWPYRYGGYRVYGWGDDHGWRHRHDWDDDDDAPRSDDWSWDD
ncbi:hypothetical protein RA307_21045 [Xanthobacteraceae bacterium Astr-EGSB]|uniref:GCG_CRPN prefix-to-repeats domain-containing protein n=1 Tax=Astrobacterium formosum TaxID=3069710 RepID=UPI0027ADA9C8|nr:hypothetical protein [Xanthobacteraceae bacterium Astr-EGSB]